MAADHLAQMPDVLRPRFRGYCGASADYVLVSSSAEEVFDESADGIYVRCGHGRAASAEDFRCRESYCSAYASSVYAVAAGRQSEVYDAGRSVPGDYYIVRLEVIVDYPSMVQIVHSVKDILEYGFSLFFGR